MEAKKFGFGRTMPPAFKFDPTDADIVACYLLPRALNLPNPYAGAIIADDPGSAPPWEVLQRHGNLHHAFFFGPPTDPSKNAGRRSRAIQGGVWHGQSGSEGTVTLLRPGGGEVDIRYKRYDLSFCLAKGRGGSTGYVMHEYEIVSPPLPGTVLTRIRVPNKANKKANRLPVAPAVAEQKVPDVEQPGPTYEYNAAAVTSSFNGFGGLQDDAPYCTPLQYALPLAEYCVSIPDQSGTSYNYDTVAMNGEGLAGPQAHAFYGGVDYNNYSDPSNYVPKCDSDYNNNYQQWQYQQDPSNQYMAGDTTVVCVSEQQAGALCDNSDNGSVVGTETSAHSTISLCGGGEVKLEDNQLIQSLVRRRRPQV